VATGWNDFPNLPSGNYINGYLIEYGTWSDPMSLTFNTTQKSEITLTQKGFLSDATLEEIPAYDRTGSAITPSLNLTYNGTSLVKDTDYTVSFSNNINVGTASVSITGIGDYYGTISSTFSIVELTTPSNQNIPANTTSWNIVDSTRVFPVSEEFALRGYDTSKNYKASVIIANSSTAHSGSSSATFDITTTSGLTLDTGYSSWTGVKEINFIGSASNIESALNSIELNTTNLLGGEIKLQVFISPQITNVFFNSANGHMYRFVSGNISWTNAASAAVSSSYESESGYLVSITSKQEQNFVNNKISATNIWIGLSDKDSEGVFKWEQGPEAGTVIRSGSNIAGQYNNWESGEPNNYGGEDYVAAKWNGGTGWNDFPNLPSGNYINGYLIEYGTWSDPMSLTFNSTQKSEIVFTQIGQGVNISATNTPTTDENESKTVDVDVSLTINPLGNVTVPLTISDATEGSITVSNIIFTKDNWNVSQTITVSGLDDELFDGTVTYTLTTGDPTSTADSNYNNLGATDVEDIEITNEDNDGISVTINSMVDCFGSNEGAATVSVNSSNTSDYTYSWDSDPVQTSNQAVDLIAGTYLVTVTDAESNSVTQTITITEPTALSLQTTFTAATEISGYLKATVSGGTPPYFFSWSNGQTASTTTEISPGEYKVIVTDANSCSTSSTITVAKAQPVIAFNDITKTYGAPDFNLTATSSGTGLYTFSIADSNVATVSGNTVSIKGAGTTIVTASQVSDTNYLAATATMTLTVNKAQPVITFNDVTKIFGDDDFNLQATSTVSSITIDYTIADNTVATVSGSTVEIVGAGITIVTASQVSDTNYLAATATMTLTVTKEQPVITFNDITLTFGDPDFNLSATSSSTGAFSFTVADTNIATVTGSTTTIVGAGTTIITASQASNANYGSATATMTLTVEKATPVITFNDITTTYGSTSSVTLSANSSSTGAFIFTLADPSIGQLAVGSTNQLNINKAGTTIVTASLAADDNYLSATATMTLTVSKATPNLGSFGPFTATYGDPDFEITTENLGDNPNHTSEYVFSSLDTAIASISSTTVTINKAGVVTLTATLAEDDRYTAGIVTTTLTIDRATQEITVTGLPVSVTLVSLRENPVPISATSTSSESVQITAVGAASVSGTLNNYELVSIDLTGIVTLTFTVPQTTNYNTATKTISIDVEKSNQEITIPDDFPTLLTYTSTLTLDLSVVSATSSLTVSSSISAENNATYTQTGDEISITHPGKLLITFSQGGNNVYNPAQSITREVNIIQGETVLTNFPDQNKSSDIGQFSLSPPTSNRTGDFIYNSSALDVATISGTTVTIIASGQTIITATQLANSKYKSAQISMTLTVGKATPTITFNDITRTFGDADFNLSATSSSTGAFTYTIADTNIATNTGSGSTTTIVGAGTTTVIVSQAADTNYLAATATMTLTITKATPVISFSDLSKTFGDADFNLSATSSSTGAFTYTIADNTIATLTGSKTTIVGAGTTTVTVSQAADNNYNSATATMTLTVGKATPVITFNDITKNYGDQDFNLTATSSSTGAFTYTIADTNIATVTGSTTTIVGTGVTIVTVSQQEATNYRAATATMSLTVDKILPTINFDDVTKTINSANFNLTTTSSSTGLFTFSIADSNVATVTGNTVSIKGLGTTIVTASQVSDTNYLAATATMTLTVTKEQPVITFNDITRTFGDADFDLLATTTVSSITIDYTIADNTVATVSGSTVKIVGAGNTIVTASQVSDTNYLAATATMTLTVNKAQPVITFNDITRTFGDADFNLSATSNSTGAFTYTISDTNIATNTGSGSTTTIVGAGTTTVTVSQAADTNYLAATATMTLTITKATPVISFSDLSKTFGDADFNLSATSSSTGAFTYTIADNTIATLTGSKTTIVGAGTTTVTLSQAADNNYNSATATMTLTVGKGTPVITFNDITKTYGAPDFNLTATSSGTGLYTFSIADSNVATVSGNTVSIKDLGTTIVTASQVSDTNYLAATATMTLTIEKAAAPIITFGDITKTYGDAYFDLQATSTLSGTITYSIANPSIASLANSLVFINQAGTTSITATQESDNYLTAIATITFTVNKAQPVISFDVVSGAVGDDIALSATSSSTGAITYAIADGSIGSISGSTLSLQATGTTQITASQVSDTNYLAATVTVNLTVSAQESETTQNEDNSDVTEQNDTTDTTPTDNSSEDTNSQTQSPTTESSTQSSTTSTETTEQLQDSDGDGTPDSQDAFPNDPDETTDSDEDGIGDNTDTDDDNDGTPDNQDAFPNDPDETTDSDGDGIGNNADSDDDNDGVSDTDEIANGSDPLSDDSDGDGTPDNQDAFPNDPDETIDTDGDGIGDNTDPDIDGDGISNQDEQTAGTDPSDPTATPTDSDGDGLVDAIDTDDDNDGTPDNQDAFPNDPDETTDSDGDGIGNNADSDDDNDGVSDTDEIANGSDPLSDDSDGDGTPDNQDAFPNDPDETIDTDGDGIGDNTDPDIDGDGISNEDEQAAGTDPSDPTATPTDSDGDGLVDAIDPDDDNDGVSDVDEAANGTNPTATDTDGDTLNDGLEASLGTDPTSSDSDGDGVDDAQELENQIDTSDPSSDTDGDGVSDAQELEDGTNPLSSDTDSDTVIDSEDDLPLDPTETTDTDGDGIGDNSDPDIDGDGISNQDEQTAGTDPSDPTATPTDSDGDGLVDAIDTDDDNDGIPDNQDAFPNDPDETTDSDGDGIGNNADSDDDNDGVSDTDEIANGSDPLSDDSDGDGTPDNQDAFPNDPDETIDTDGDGIGDNTDPDIDGDGISNEDEQAAGTDPSDPTATPKDSDGDGLVDAIDTDDDNDGTPDNQDAFPNDPDETTDSDGDGIGNNADSDDDNDGVSDTDEIANGSDPLSDDSDGDGTPDNQDAFPNDPDETMDTDGDGIGNNLDSDDDNDGIADSEDLDNDNDNYTDQDEQAAGTDPYDPTDIPSDFDQDGVSDASDLDDDNDGVNDSEDAFPFDPLETKDTDGDGIGDNQDPVNDLEPDNSSENTEIPESASYGISPNGDGINDELILDYLKAYPDNILYVFDRQGRIVYSIEGYMQTSDRFQGFNQSTGGLLPQGTYFFRIEIRKASGEQQTVQGYIYVNY
jgi:gliding motility-associated-like protein